MAEINEGVQLEQPGQVVDGSPQGNQPVGSALPVQPVQQDADVMAATKALERLQQSENDKQAAVLAKGMKKLKEAGFNVTAEQVLQLVSNKLTSLSDLIPDQKVVQLSPEIKPASTVLGQDESDQVVQKARWLMEEYAGGMLPADAPETKLIAKDTSDEKVFLESVRAASKAYSERTANLSNPARLPTLAAGTGAAAPNLANKSSTQILEEYYEDHPIVRR